MTLPEKKIFLEKTHDLEFAVSKIIEAETDRVIINIPRESVIGALLHNFQVLRREAETAGKDIFIESVDDHILELASIVGIPAKNPVFKNSERAVFDILPRSNFKKRMTEVQESFDHEPIEISKPNPKKKKEVIKSVAPKSNAVFEEEVAPMRLPREESEVKEKRPFSFRRLFAVLLIFAVFLGGIKIVVAVIPQARVHITLKKTLVEFKENIEVSSKANKPEILKDKIIIPGELLVSEKNMSGVFKASGKERIEVKAAGTLTVYNAYSSQPQTLLKSTRFESPDKKIFRLTKQVIIPGAKIVDGKIVASKIEVPVEADEAGDAYNLAPSTPWHIPGFKGSPRYEGFYAESISQMTGGFIGERAHPTTADLDVARKSLTASLRNALSGEMAVLTNQNFKLFEDAESFKSLEEKIDTSSGAPDSFNFFLRGELRRIVFEEKTLEDSLVSKAKGGLPEGLRYLDFKSSYGSRSFDFSAGRMSFGATGSMAFENDVRVDEVTKAIVGKDEKSLQSLVFALPGLEKATISLWPFWVKKVPEDVKKIKVEID